MLENNKNIINSDDNKETNNKIIINNNTEFESDSEENIKPIKK